MKFFSIYFDGTSNKIRTFDLRSFQFELQKIAVTLPEMKAEAPLHLVRSEGRRRQSCVDPYLTLLLKNDHRLNCEYLRRMWLHFDLYPMNKGAAERLEAG